jgi:hypothetical protein
MERRDAAGHADRGQERPLDRGVPRRALRSGEHLAGRREHRVRVLEDRPRLRGRLRGEGGAQVLLAREHARLGRQVRVGLEPGLVRQHVPQRDEGLRLGSRHPEVGEEAPGRLVERDEPPVLGGGQRQGREGLRAGADREQRVRSDRLPAGDVGEAARPEHEDRIVLDRDEGEARDVLALLLLGQDRVDAGQILGRRGSGQGEQEHGREAHAPCNVRTAGEVPVIPKPAPLVAECAPKNP